MIRASNGTGVALEPIRISRPVRPLVMVPDGRTHFLQHAELTAQLIADYRVLLHQRVLRGREAVGLQQNGVGNGDLAHVVEKRASIERDLLVEVEPQARS